MDSSEGTIDTKLHDAVRVGDIEEVQTALRHGYDPNLIGVYGWSPLHEAAHNGETEILKLLLGKKGLFVIPYPVAQNIYFFMGMDALKRETTLSEIVLSPLSIRVFSKKKDLLLRS